ncbi:MAG: phage/plasmid primase, P4 family [Magnetococcus sp. YQC-5]
MDNRQTSQAGEVSRSGRQALDADTLKAQTDLVDFIGRYVKLAKVGREWEGCCIFHDDSAPSFKVDQVKQLWKCFGCGAGGDLWAFIQKAEGLNFTESVQFLARKGSSEFHPPPPASTEATAVWVPILPIPDDAPPPPSHHYKHGVSSGRWTYRDGVGLPAFSISRFDKAGGGKEFLPLTYCRNRKTGETAWRWQGAPAPRPLYHLDQLTADPDALVVVTEGERKNDAATAILPGTVGVTSANGKGSAGKTDWTPLAQRHVILWPDNDQAGREYIDEVTKLLRRAGAASIRVIRLEFFHTMPDGATRAALPVKWDAYDAQLEGFTAEHGRVLLADPANFQDVQPEPTQATSEQDGKPLQGAPTPPVSLTQFGLAERLVKRFGENIRYCFPFKKWFVYDGKRWAEDRSGTMLGYAKAVVRGIYQEAAQAGDHDQREKLSKFAVTSEKLQHLTAMLTLAQADVPVLPEQFDTDHMLFNAANGTIDLKTGELRPHSKIDFLRKISDVAYTRNATAPTWERFLDRIFSGDKDLIFFVQKAAGYSLTGSTEEQCLFFLYGKGKNGKSTFTETLQSVLGDYAMRLPTEALMAKRTGESTASNDIARLCGMRVVVSSEIADDQRLNEAKIKDLTGGDTVTARFLFAEFFDFVPTHKFWIFGNHKPVIKGMDLGIWRRIRLIPFLVTFTDETADASLKEKLSEERPGILRWLIDGCLAWQREGIKVPTAVSDATDEYRSEMDLVGPFISDRCVVGEGLYAKTGELFAAYQAWCRETGTQEITQTKFGKYLTERGFKQAVPVKIGGRTARLRYGIGLLADGAVTGSNTGYGLLHDFPIIKQNTPSQGKDTGRRVTTRNPDSTCNPLATEQGNVIPLRFQQNSSENSSIDFGCADADPDDDHQTDWEEFSF